MPNKVDESELRIDEVNESEFGILVVFWHARAEHVKALKLSDVYWRLNKRRQEMGEEDAAPTTISTYLRSLAKKKLLREVSMDEPESKGQAAAVRGPARRSPKTGYTVQLEPSRLLRKRFAELAAAYPPEQRLQALVDCAEALELPQKTVLQLKKLVRLE